MTEKDGRLLIIATIQEFSDKYLIYLRSEDLTLYPLHINALNFIEEVRREQNEINKPLLAYPPDTHEATEADLTTQPFDQLEKGLL